MGGSNQCNVGNGIGERIAVQVHFPYTAKHDNPRLEGRGRGRGLAFWTRREKARDEGEEAQSRYRVSNTEI